MLAHKKKVLFISVGIITLVVVIILALLLEIKAFKPQIEAAASKAVGMEVRIKGRLGIDLFPRFGLSLKDTSVRKGGTEVATVEKMRIGLKLIPLIMRREVVISRIGLIKPVFSIVRYKNGMFNFEKPGGAPSGKPLAVNKISISRGKVVYTAERSGDKIEVDGFDVTIRNLSYSGTDGAEPFKNISFTGNIRCKTLTINNFTLTNLVMRAAGENGVFDINPVRMNIFDGTGNGSIHVDVTGASPRYRVITAFTRLRIEEVVQAFSPGKFPRKGIEGSVNISADLTAAGKSADKVKRSLNGDLSLNGENLMLYSIDIDALITKYERSQNFNLVDVGAFFLAGPLGPVLTKSYNFGSLYEESRGGKGSIKKLVSIWKVNHGIAGATDVALASNKHRIAMKGGLNLISDQFVNVTVAVLDKRGCAVYSEKVHGPFSKPQIAKISIFKSIGGSVSNALEDAWKFIQHEKCAVFYSGSVAQPEG